MSIRTEAIRLAAQRYKDDDCLEAFIDGAEFGPRRAERSFEDFTIHHSEWSYWARKGRPEQGAESLWEELCDRDAYAALSWISESLDAMKYIWPRLGKKIPEPSWMALTDRKRNEELARKAMQ